MEDPCRSPLKGQQERKQQLESGKAGPWKGRRAEYQPISHSTGRRPEPAALRPDTTQKSYTVIIGLATRTAARRATKNRTLLLSQGIRSTKCSQLGDTETPKAHRTVGALLSASAPRA